MLIFRLITESFTERVEFFLKLKNFLLKVTNSAGVTNVIRYGVPYERSGTTKITGTMDFLIMRSRIRKIKIIQAYQHREP